jgi:hypothetical protein
MFLQSGGAQAESKNEIAAVKTSPLKSSFQKRRLDGGLRVKNFTADGDTN